jgi:predicted RNase H-like HicB family nuclease
LPPMGNTLTSALLRAHHAHRDSVLHLVEDHRPLEIRHLAGEFAPAIDRPRMHHDGFWLGQVHVLQLQAVEAEILARRKTRLMLPRIVLDSAVPIATRSGKMEVAMVEIQPIRVEIEREEDGRILASVPDLPGVMAYGSTEDEAIRKVKSMALQVLADMIESDEDVPGPLKVLFAA